MSRFASSALFTGWAFLVAAALIACGDDSERGTLVVRVESDLALPKDLDLVRVEVTRRGETLLAKERDLFDPQSRALEFTIPSDGDSSPVRALAVGYKQGEVRVERLAITQLPRSQKRLLTLPLRYLCSGKQSECKADETCDQGVCTKALVRSESLPEYGDAESERARPDANAGNCMNVVECFTEASVPAVDSGSCSFAVSDDLELKSLNVGLRFSRGGSGVCGADGCFIALDAGDAGWNLAEGSVQLPSEVCRDGAPFTVVYSTSCATKTSEVAVCLEPPSAAFAISGAGDVPPASSASVPPAIGTACEPPAVESCGMCGIRSRMCQGGQWSDWSECIGSGVCEADAQEACENRGTRVCRADCQWGPCEGQRCDGPDTMSCGNCGARHRTCSNGKWSEWSECGEQGRCTPNAVQLCQPEGAQACRGNCNWDACTVQACSGVASQACGRCGTQRRGCNAATGVWADWGECLEQGECTPDETKSCGESGRNTCLGSCTWDPVCRDQVCLGGASMTCEKCGTKTRTCDTERGVWSDWGECDEQRACTPNETRSCGLQGVERCNASCEWSGTCAGQVCTGEKERGCERCGRQTRECDSSTGAWGEWSSCADQGACQAGEMGACGTDGMRACGVDCQWSACSGQACNEPLERACDRCGKQQRTCDSDTGKVSARSACLDQGACNAGEMKTCGRGGSHVCSRACQWPTECHDQKCDVPPTRGCDRCGTERSTCNGDTGIATWSACTNQGECSADQSDVCGRTGRKVCSTACSWSDCDCGAGSKLCGDVCTNVQSDVNNCGGCGLTCKRGEACSAGQCKVVCPAEAMCGPNNECVDLTTSNVHCGKCNNGCDTGFSCQSGVCDCAAPTSRCNMVCLNLESDPDHCGSCMTSCPRPAAELGRATCTKGACGVECFDLSASEGPKLSACGSRCVNLTSDPSNCGECGTECVGCQGGECPGGSGGAGAGGAGTSGAGTSGAGAGGAGTGGAGTSGAGARATSAGGAGAEASTPTPQTDDDEDDTATGSAGSTSTGGGGEGEGVTGAGGAGGAA